MANDAEMKTRVPKAMKQAFKAIAQARTTYSQTVGESDVAREAMLEYLQHRGYVLEDNGNILPPESLPTPPTEPVHYRGKSKGAKGKPSSSSKMDTDRKIADIIREGTSGPKQSGTVPPKAKS